MSAPLTVEDALVRILACASPITNQQTVPLEEADGRVLARPLQALLTQPPFSASAMDGYAVRAADVVTLPARLRVIGEAAAGHAFADPIAAGEAVRIFTGAPIPPGASAIVIQENTERAADHVVVTDGKPDAEHIRPCGGDFRSGDTLIGNDRRLTSRDITLAAAMGHGRIEARRRPVVAVLATGDELVVPGATPGPDQIVCSNALGVAAMVRMAGGEPRLIGIARDSAESLGSHIDRAAAADILVTIGGASVGDHDLVGPVLARRGLDLSFWKIAMRPGKPLMYGRLDGQHVLGLPGNPVSSLVCARLFLVPLVRALLGLEPEPDRSLDAVAACPIGRNGPRAHYMRATLTRAAGGVLHATPAPNQDSSLIRPLAAADCLLVRPINAAPTAAGDRVPVLLMDF